MNRSFVLCVIASTSLAASARAHLDDIGLKVLTGQIFTGQVKDIGFGQFVEPGLRVFGADMGDVQVGFSDEPGYYCPDGSFVLGTGVGFDIRRALRRWNGSDFNAIASQTMLVENGAQTLSRTTPAADVVVPGFVFQTVDASGGFDEHLNFTVSDPNTPAIYLLELQTTGSGLTTSDPYWIVFNNGLSESEHAAAVDWVQNNLAPAPASVGLLGVAWLVGGKRRRT